MMAAKFFELFQGKLIQAYDSCLGTILGWNYTTGFLFAVHIDNDPAAVDSVITAEFGVRDEVRARLQQHFDGIDAGYCFRRVWNFDQKSGHENVSPRSEVEWDSIKLGSLHKAGTESAKATFSITELKSLGAREA
jgi:hypothetical protein